MPSPNAVLTEIVATTFRNHSNTCYDNLSRHNALYTYLKKKNKIKRVSGGTSIAKILEYAANSTYQRYSGLDLLNTTQAEAITGAEYAWRQIALNVVIPGIQILQNSGKEMIKDLGAAKVANAMNTFANNFSNDMYGDGTLVNQIGGLQLLVGDTGLGSPGGIDSSVWPFWRNRVQSAAAPLQGGGAITPGPATIESLMLPAYMEVTRSGDKPDLIVASNNYYAFFEQSQTSLKRYMNVEKADAGFEEMSYKGTPVIFDGVSGMADSRMYFLNTNYLGLVIHTDRDLVTMDEAKPFNQDGVVIPILWAGNMITTNRSLQLVLKT